MGVAVATKPFETKLSTSILKKAQYELGEDEERRQQVIEIIRQWLAQQPHLQRIRMGTINKKHLFLL